MKKTRSLTTLYKALSTLPIEPEHLNTITTHELKLLMDNPNNHESNGWTVSDLNTIQLTYTDRFTSAVLEVFRPHNLPLAIINELLEASAKELLHKVPIIEPFNPVNAI